MDSLCRAWSKGDPLLEAYHDHEWCKISHDENHLFELLCLEGASVGLSWKLIMHKRKAYQEAFHHFDIDRCAMMDEAELASLFDNPNLVRNKAKIRSVASNARAVKQIQREFGSFDNYLWGFAGNKVIDGHYKTLEEVPTVSRLSILLSKDMKRRGIQFMGPTITYSFLQAVGIVNDHLIDCEFR